MTWLEHHQRSERLASEAETAWRKAKRAYREAASAEMAALENIDRTKARTLGITVVSAAALYFKAREFSEAEKLARWWIDQGVLPRFADGKLKSLLWAIRTSRAAAPSEPVDVAGPEQALDLVWFSLDGGAAGGEGPPLGTVAGKMGTVEKIWYLTAEYGERIPFGESSLRRSCRKRHRPSLVQVARGSFQFAVASEAEVRLGGSDVSGSREESPINQSIPNVASLLVKILGSGVSVPDRGFEEAVQSPDYRNEYLRLTAQLAPDGKQYDMLTIQSANGQPIQMDTTKGRQIRKLWKESCNREEEGPRQLRGTLRAVDLDKHWLELTDDRQRWRVTGYAGDASENWIGSLLNHRVVVDVNVAGGKVGFRSIQRA